MKKRLIMGGLLCCCLLGGLTACQNREETTKVVLTTGFGADEVFRIEKISCTLPEIKVYLTNTQNRYEAVFGEQIWERDLEGVTLEDNIKDIVLARIAQIKVMNLLAKNSGVALSDTEMETVEKAASAYFDGLNEKEVESMGVTKETIVTLYKEYATANKVYADMIKDINPEISDDEARTIRVEYLVKRTYAMNGLGEKVAYSEEMKKKAYEEILEIQKKVKDGEDFLGLAEQYSEDAKTSLSFGKGEMEPEFEEAAFQLGNGDISGIITTENGYYLIKCISTFDKEETDANKIKIMEQRKREVFDKTYEDFVNSLTKNMNEKLWDGVTFIHDEQVKTKNFFQIYNEYFPDLLY